MDTRNWRTRASQLRVPLHLLALIAYSASPSPSAPHPLTRSSQPHVSGDFSPNLGSLHHQAMW